jgi:aminomethyltransferase
MEMNAFKDPYAAQVVKNAKVFARSLKACGLDVAGDAKIDFTETHQVIVNVGYAQGPRVARRLEDNNIICNYQAAPQEEGFTASGALRMGVAEMTRFGMVESDFETVAQWMADTIKNGSNVKQEVSRFRKRFTDMLYCFGGEEMKECLQKLHELR